LADAQHLPHGRCQAGDRHLNFHETRDNLPARPGPTKDISGKAGVDRPHRHAPHQETSKAPNRTRRRINLGGSGLSVSLGQVEPPRPRLARLETLLPHDRPDQLGADRPPQLVTRLRQQGLLDDTSVPSPVGPPRTVLSLTSRGEAALARWSTQWRSMNAAVARLLEPVEGRPCSAELQSGGAL